MNPYPYSTGLQPGLSHRENRTAAVAGRHSPNSDAFAQSGSDLESQDLESANDALLEGLSSKVSMLKNVCLVLNAAHCSC